MERVDRRIRIARVERETEDGPWKLTLEGVICEAGRPNQNGIVFTEASLKAAFEKYNDGPEGVAYWESHEKGKVAVAGIKVAQSPDDPQVFIATGTATDEFAELSGAGIDKGVDLPLAFSACLQGRGTYRVHVVADQPCEDKVFEIESLESIGVFPVEMVQPGDRCRRGFILVSDEAIEDGFLEIFTKCAPISIYKSERDPESRMNRVEMVCDLFDEVEEGVVPEYKASFVTCFDGSWRLEKCERVGGK